MKSTTGLTLVPLIVIGISVLAGCGAGEPKVDMAAAKVSIDKVDVATKIFDASGGDMSKVSPEDKAKLLKTFESQENVNSIWKGLGTRMGGPAATHEKPK